jgi:serine/threonine protein kinase
MSEAWNNWIGQVVDHKYQLQQYLGTTDHSVVFLAEFRDPEPRQTAIKFVSADFSEKEQQLATWKQAEQLSHPHLMRIYGSGTCRVEDMDLLYVAMEYAEENLGQVLPHRALLADETNEMLHSIVDVLVYLHDRDLVHGHVKPSNVLAAGDLLKLSSDTIFAAGSVREMRREHSAYDAPELPGAPYTPASDVWSLGVTLVEALTQQPAVLPFNENAEPIIPPAVHDPFLEVARHTLRRNPRLRWSSGQLAEQLNPSEAEAKAVAAVAGARVSGGMNASAGGSVITAPPTVRPVLPAVSPLNVPLSKEPAIVLGKLPPLPPMDSVRTRSRSAEDVATAPPAVALPSYAIPLFAGALLVIALIVLPFALRRRGSSDANSASSTGAASSTQAAVSRPSSSDNGFAPPASVPPAKAATVVPPTTTPSSTAVRPPAAPPPAPRHNEELAAPAAGAKSSGSVAAEGEALDQVKPAASAKALSSIHGTVRVAVKVHVDAAGKVTEATLDSTGPSRYFADLSLKAARQWVFTAPEADGHSAPSDWRIQFHYTQSGVQMSSEQLRP